MSVDTSNPIIKFLVPDLHSQYDIGIADASFYPTGFTITSPTVEITPPSFPKIALPYTHGTLTVFNSNDLKISCTTDITQIVPLPDGVWTIRMSIAPNTQWFSTMSYTRTTNIRRKFGMAVMKTDITQCSNELKSQQQAFLDEVDFYIECATAAGNDCNALVATNLIQTANKMLTDFLDNRPNYYLNPGYYIAGL